MEISPTIDGHASIREYLQDMSQLYRTMDLKDVPTQLPTELLLAHGRAINPVPFTPEERAEILLTLSVRFGSMRYPIKQCFYNAQMVVMGLQDPRFTYMEGYAVKHRIGLPMAHGWVLFNNKVIDLTWRHDEHTIPAGPKPRGRLANRILGDFRNVSYFGLDVPVTLIRQRAVATGWVRAVLMDGDSYRPLLDHYQALAA